MVLMSKIKIEFFSLKSDIRHLIFNLVILWNFQTIIQKGTEYEFLAKKGENLKKIKKYIIKYKNQFDL